MGSSLPCNTLTRHCVTLPDINIYFHLWGQSWCVVWVWCGWDRGAKIFCFSSKGVSRSLDLRWLVHFGVCNDQIMIIIIIVMIMIRNPLPNRLGSVMAAGPGPANSAAMGPRRWSMINIIMIMMIMTENYHKIKHTDNQYFQGVWLLDEKGLTLIWCWRWNQITLSMLHFLAILLKTRRYSSLKNIWNRHGPKIHPVDILSQNTNCDLSGNIWLAWSRQSSCGWGSLSSCGLVLVLVGGPPTTRAGIDHTTHYYRPSFFHGRASQLPEWQYKYK